MHKLCHRLTAHVNTFFLEQTQNDFSYTYDEATLDITMSVSLSVGPSKITMFFRAFWPIRSPSLGAKGRAVFTALFSNCNHARMHFKTQKGSISSDGESRLYGDFTLRGFLFINDGLTLVLKQNFLNFSHFLSSLK